MPAANLVPTAGGDWAIPAAELAKYAQIFSGMQPVNGKLSGDKVRPVLLNSKLPMDVLGRVWDLSDVDKDGMLDGDEFALVSGFRHYGFTNYPKNGLHCCSQVCASMHVLVCTYW